MSQSVMIQPQSYIFHSLSALLYYYHVTLQGSPVLEYFAGCQYIFEWDTNVVCERNNTDIAKGKCVYQDPVSGAMYNFTGLRKAQPIKVNPL